MSTQPASAKIRRTANEIARDVGLRLPLGQGVWELTNEIRLPSPIVEIRGRYRREFVAYPRGGKQFKRRYVEPNSPNTERQLDHQERVRVVSRRWKEVSAENRLQWGEYAVQHLHPEQQGKYLGGIGQQLFNSAQQQRLSWGGDMTDAPPGAPPPARAWSMTQIPALAGQLAWRLEHGVAEPQGYMVEVKITPATPNNRAPRKTDRRRAGATTEGSFFPLGGSGAAYLLASPRFPIAPGERYGIWVRLLTPDGVKGPEYYADLVQGEAENGTVVAQGEAPSGFASEISTPEAGAGARLLSDLNLERVYPRTPRKTVYVHEKPVHEYHFSVHGALHGAAEFRTFGTNHHQASLRLRALCVSAFRFYSVTDGLLEVLRVLFVLCRRPAPRLEGGLHFAGGDAVPGGGIFAGGRR